MLTNNEIKDIMSNLILLQNRGNLLKGTTNGIIGQEVEDYSVILLVH